MAADGGGTFGLAAVDRRDTALHVALPCVAVGAVAWTIAEYAAHRWLYHARIPLWRVGYEMHHALPELLIGLPWFATAGLVAACWYLVAYTLHVHAVSSGLAGFLAALAVHGVLHHSHHHHRLSLAAVTRQRWPAGSEGRLAHALNPGARGPSR